MELLGKGRKRILLVVVRAPAVVVERALREAGHLVVVRRQVQAHEQAARLAQVVDALPGLHFAGLMTYPPFGSAQDQIDVNDWLVEAKLQINQAGLECDLISSGGSPNMWHAHTSEIATEHRSGTYVYNDRSLIEKGVCEVENCALTVLATVVSCPTDIRAIIDAGSKTLTSDLLGLNGYGYICCLTSR